MKATGIVRKLDDLGRVVIPKEIRCTQGWGDREALEIFVGNEGVILRKYNPPTEERNRIFQNLISLQLKTDDPEIVAGISEAIQFFEKK
jgi:AbrB family looped-hinge helix DNA binding protein